MLPALTVTNEQINSLPLLLGISIGTVVTLWLSHLLQAHDHRLVAVRDWVAQRTHTINTLLLALPADLYDRLTHPHPNSLVHLRE